MTIKLQSTNPERLGKEKGSKEDTLTSLGKGSRINCFQISFWFESALDKKYY